MADEIAVVLPAVGQLGGGERGPALRQVLVAQEVAEAPVRGQHRLVDGAAARREQPLALAGREGRREVGERLEEDALLGFATACAAAVASTPAIATRGGVMPRARPRRMRAIDSSKTRGNWRSRER